MNERTKGQGIFLSSSASSDAAVTAAHLPVSKTGFDRLREGCFKKGTYEGRRKVARVLVQPWLISDSPTWKKLRPDDSRALVRAPLATATRQHRLRELDFLDEPPTMADELLNMFQSITTADHDELVDQFAHLLELDTHTATFFLESSNWNVETAVNNYLATMEPALFHDHNHYHDHQQQVDDLAMDDDDQENRDEAPSGLYDAQFVTDHSAAQSTVIPPSTVVDMQWSFVNSGPTPWPADTHLVFAQGDSFDGPVQIPVASVVPGARIDLPIRLRTPSQMGSFSGSWRLVSSHGPIGEPMWLVLNVGPTKQEAFEPAAGPGLVVASAPSSGFSNNDDDMMDL